jgi:hypothetical protein
MIIKGLAQLSAAAKSRFLVLIPMSYPDNSMYREEVRKVVEGADIEYRILDKKMSIEDIARMRIVSDYVVNIQTTDSLSASIQEHLFAGSSMIVGKWLPYSVLERMGIHLHKVERVEEITAALEKAALAGEVERRKPDCADRIYDYSSWSSNASRWLQLYGEYDSDGSDGSHKLPRHSHISNQDTAGTRGKG